MISCSPQQRASSSYTGSRVWCVLLCAYSCLAPWVIAAIPGPPNPLGTISPASMFILVDNVLPDAQVNVYDASTEPKALIATGTFSASAGLVAVPVTGAPLIEGHQVTAQQITTAGDSGQNRPGGLSIERVERMLPPDNPAIRSDVHVCMEFIFIDNVLPGAEVDVTVGAHLLGAATATLNSVVVVLEPNHLTPGDVVKVTQSFRYDGHTYTSSSSTDRLKSFNEFMGQRERALIIDQPLRACDMQINFTQSTPGSALTMRNEGNWQDNYVPLFKWDMGLVRPLKESKVVINDSLPVTCNKGSLSDLVETFHVDPAKSWPPQQASLPCASTPQACFTALRRGGTLFIARHSPTGDDVRQWPITTHSGDQCFNLPGDWNLGESDTTFTFGQIDPCGTTNSDSLSLQIDNDPPPNTLLQIISQLWECSEFVPYVSGPTSAFVSVWSTDTGDQLSKFVPTEVGHGTKIHTPQLFRSLQAGPDGIASLIELRQEGCGWRLRSDPVSVAHLPDTLPAPEYVPKDGAPSVDIYVTGQTLDLEQLFTGATVNILADNVVYYPFEPIVPDVGPTSITISGRLRSDWPYPFIEGQIVTITQSFKLCNNNKTSPGSIAKTVVKSPLMAVFTDLLEIPKGHTSQVHVIVMDRSNNNCPEGNTNIQITPSGIGNVNDPTGRGCDFHIIFNVPSNEIASKVLISAKDQYNAYIPNVAKILLGSSTSIVQVEKAQFVIA